MAYSVQIKDGTGRVVIGIEGKPKDLVELLAEAQSFLTKYIQDRMLKGLSDDLVQPLVVTWGESDA